MRKAWIHTLYDDPWIVSSKDAKLGFVQNMDWPKLKRGYESVTPLPSFVFSMKFC